MSNLSDKELDRLSREAADSYEPDTSSLTWTRLEQKLVQQMPERPPDGIRFGQIKPWVWGPAVVMLAGISFYFIKNSFYSKDSTRKKEPVSQIKSTSDAGSSKPDATAAYTDSISAEGQSGAAVGTAKSTDQSKAIPGSGEAVSESSASRSQYDASHPNSSGSSASPGDNSRVTENTAPAVLSSKGTVTPSVNQAGPGINNSVKNGRKSKWTIPVTGTTAGIIAGNEASATSASGSTDLKNPDNLQANGSAEQKDSGVAKKYQNQLSLPQPVYGMAAPGLVKGNDSLLNRLAQSKVPAPVKSLRINRSLNIGLAFGPDYTDAGGITNNQFSNNIGLTIGYYLTNKLSVNTGIFYSNKFYWSPGHKDARQVNYAATTFAYAPPIEYVNGSCNMYELPLTLRYDFAKNEKTKFFVNAGVSSYFMLKQTYIYFFHSGGRGLAFKATDESQVNYWMGMGDISFGLETDIGRGFSFQAEPFFRIPLKQMGVENLKLYSYGFMISFRYAPVLSRTKK